MATAANRVIQDQNLNFLYNGVTPSGKTNNAAAKPAAKKLGRKALNDISNSRKIVVPQSTKKENPTNILSIENDPHIGKGFSKAAPEKGKIGGRKVLGDLTNSVRHTSQKASKAGQKVGAVCGNVPSSVADERWLHNHNKCIKAQTMGPDMDFFMKTIGLNKGNKNGAKGPLTPPKKVERNMMRLEMEEVLYGDETRFCNKSELTIGYISPACRSPTSPKSPSMNWEEDDSISDLMMLISSP